MARVFLSYDRDDASKARAIAEALENAGHAVWWDFRIQGGAEYTKEIEQALANADAVVVLWSKCAVESAWVRDEAAAGRDRGRLVPVRLDGAMPPLGFRQYQNVDLSSWKGRGRPPLKEVLSAIESLPCDIQDSSSAQRGIQNPHPSKRRRVRLLPFISLALIAAAALAALHWQPWRTERHAPLVAVVPAENNSAADPLAADLLIKLGVLQSSHADALQLVDVDSRQVPDFIIKVGSANVGSGPRANLMLVDNRAGTLLWSGEFSGPSGGQADLRQQMAYSAAKVLDCAVQALLAKDETIELPTLTLYLSGCANLSNLLAQDPQAAITIFAKVTEQAPKLEDAWKKLILAEIQALRIGGRSDPLLRRNLQDRVEQARRLYPAIAEAFLAEGWLRPPRPMAGWMSAVDRSLAEDPDNPDILAYHSLARTNVGLMQEALTDAQRAVKSDPLSPSARDALVTAMLNSGQVEAAKGELEKSERLWPGATSVLQARFAYEFRVGNAARALGILRSGQLGARFAPDSPHANAADESYLKARIEPSLENKRRAIAAARAHYAREPVASWVVARALSEFGRHEDLINFLLTSDTDVPVNTTWTLFRPSFGTLHLDPRFMAVAKRMGVLDYWKQTGKWPDFCGRPDLPYDCQKEAARLGA